MKARSIRRRVLFAMISSLVSLGGGPVRAATLCTWGGTAEATTGVVTLTPGVRAVPAAEPLKFVATGPLEGGGRCSGTMTFDGELNAGSSCAYSWFEGTVRGVPGVESFWGEGGVLVHEFLSDADGNLVGSDQVQILTGVGSGSKASDCNTPEGFTDGSFSAIVELYE
jgi:hypothetical protein